MKINIIEPRKEVVTFMDLAYGSLFCMDGGVFIKVFIGNGEGANAIVIDPTNSDGVSTRMQSIGELTLIPSTTIIVPVSEVSLTLQDVQRP